MGKAADTDLNGIVRNEASVTSNQLLVPSPASVLGPTTPESALQRRMSQTSNAEAFYRDSDDEGMELVSYADNDELDMMEEPVALSRVRAYALAKCCRGRESKVTLESAKAKLERVREKHLTKRKLDNFLSGHVDTELIEQPKVVESKGFSVEKARAKLEAVKTKELAKSKGVRRTSKGIKMPRTRNSTTASETKIIDEKIPHEGVWVWHAKVKLEAAREKKTKQTRKRKSKKNILLPKSSSETSLLEKSMEGVDVEATNAADDVEVTLASVVAKEANITGKKKKASKQKAVRFSQRIANSRLRLQQELLTTVKPKGETGSKKIKSRRKKRNKTEESDIEMCTDPRGTEMMAEATTSDRGAEASPALSLDFTSSIETTPPVKSRKKQQIPVDCSLPGARLSAGVECVPPVSPYGLIQEHLYQDPWKVLVACMLLNRTGGRQMHKVIWEFFELCPDAEKCISTETEEIGRVIRSLGLQNKRAKTLQRFSEDYLGTTWTNVTQLHGIGEYARDAYAIFCEGRWQDVQPNDVVLKKYWQWLSNTQADHHQPLTDTAPSLSAFYILETVIRICWRLHQVLGVEAARMVSFCFSRVREVLLAGRMRRGHYVEAHCSFLEVASWESIQRFESAIVSPQTSTSEFSTSSVVVLKSFIKVE